MEASIRESLVLRVPISNSEAEFPANSSLKSTKVAVAENGLLRSGEPMIG